MLALALLAQSPQAMKQNMDMTRTQLFDHVSVAAPAGGPWRVMTRAGDGWSEAPADILEADGARSLHLRARSLGEPSEGAAPEGAAWRIRVQSGEDAREGFLVPGAPTASTAGRLSGHAYASEDFSLEFTGGSGFYRNFRTGQGMLSEAIGFRIGGRALGIIPFERTDADFRFDAIRADGGHAFIRRRAEVAVKALVRWSEAKPSTLYLGSDLIEQEVLIDLPRALILLGNAIDVENWFTLPADARVLLPGAARFEAPGRLPADHSYEWIVVATAGGGFVHWLELPGNEQALGPKLYASKRRSGGWRVGYRLEDVEESWEEADPESDGVRMVQWVAWLGGPEFVKALEADGAAGELARSLASPHVPWRVELEKLR